MALSPWNPDGGCTTFMKGRLRNTRSTHRRLLKRSAFSPKETAWFMLKGQKDLWKGISRQNYPRIRVHFCLQRMNLSWAPEHGHPFPVAQDMFHWLLHQHYSDGSWCWVHQQLQNQPIYHNRVWFSNRRGKSHTKTCLIRRKMQRLQTMLDEWKDAMTSVFIESEIWPDGIFTVQGCINLPGWGDCPPKKMNIS